MADLGGTTTSKTKNQKKRARKKIKKAGTEGGGASAGGEIERGEEEVVGVGEVGSERGAEERVVVVCDPVMELKEKLEEAKAKKDHVGAQKLREELWKLRDKGPSAADPRFTAQVPGSATALQDDPQLSSSADPLDKKMSKLKKKLKQIEALEQRQAKGETLEANQLTKLTSKHEVLEEIAEIEEILAVS